MSSASTACPRTARWTITSELTEIEGRSTTLRATLHYATPEARDAMLASDMAAGVRASYDRLAAILAES